MRQDSRSTKIATADRMHIAQARVDIRSGQFWQSDETTVGLTSLSVGSVMALRCKARPLNSHALWAWQTDMARCVTLDGHRLPVEQALPKTYRPLPRMDESLAL
jgi:hypothetical protein